MTAEQWPVAPEGSAMRKFLDLLAEHGFKYGGSDGDGGNFICPCHDDTHASLHVEVGRSRAVVAHCRACGVSLPAVLDALAARSALTVVGTRIVPAAAPLGGSAVEPDAVNWGFERAPGTGRGKASGDHLGKHLHTVLHDYLLPSGEPIRRVTRAVHTQGKVIAQLRPFVASTGFQGWIGGVQGVPITPYYWEAFAEWQAQGKRGLYVTEGEKAADALVDAGAAATTYPGGANAPLPTVEEVREHFAGWPAFKVWADADKAGVKRAFKVADRLREAFGDSAKVAVVMNDGPVAKGDDAADIEGLSKANIKEKTVTVETPEQALSRLADATVEPPEEEKPTGTDKRVIEKSKYADATLAEWAFDVLERSGRTLLPVAGLGWIRLDRRTGTWRLCETDDGAKRAILRALERVGKKAISKGDSDTVDVVMRARNDSKLSSVTRMYRTMYGDRVSAEMLDAAPYVRAFSNGLVDVRTGQFVPPEQARDLYITRSTGLPFDPGATHPLLDKVFGAQDPVVMEYLLDALALAFAGEDRANPVTYVLQGNGSNAKTSLMGCAVASLGSYAGAVSHKVITASPTEHTTERTDLRGLAVAWIEELPDVPLNVASLKQIDRGAGGVVARRMRQDDMTFTPTAYLFVTGNFLPRVRDTDYGTWRRLQHLKMEATFKGTADPTIRTRLLRDREVHTAFIAELVRRCVRLAENDWRLETPAEVEEWTEDWQAKADPVLRYFRDRIEEDLSSPGIRVSDLVEDMGLYSANPNTASLPSASPKALDRLFGPSALPVKYETKKSLRYVALDGEEVSLNRHATKVTVWPGLRWKPLDDDDDDDGGGAY